jgi:hypothetical protein
VTSLPFAPLASANDTGAYITVSSGGTVLCENGQCGQGADPVIALIASGEPQYGAKRHFPLNDTFFIGDFESLPVYDVVSKNFLGEYLSSGLNGFIIGLVERRELGSFEIFLQRVMAADIEVVPGHYGSIETSPRQLTSCRLVPIALNHLWLVLGGDVMAGSMPGGSRVASQYNHRQCGKTAIDVGIVAAKYSEDLIKVMTEEVKGQGD